MDESAIAARRFQEPVELYSAGLRIRRGSISYQAPTPKPPPLFSNRSTTLTESTSFLAIIWNRYLKTNPYGAVPAPWTPLSEAVSSQGKVDCPVQVERGVDWNARGLACQAGV